jgi:hypothetical protein
MVPEIAEDGLSDRGDAHHDAPRRRRKMSAQPRTVEWHMSKILSKPGITSRRRLRH